MQRRAGTRRRGCLFTARRSPARDGADVAILRPCDRGAPNEQRSSTAPAPNGPRASATSCIGTSATPSAFGHPRPRPDASGILHEEDFEEVPADRRRCIWVEPSVFASPESLVRGLITRMAIRNRRSEMGLLHVPRKRRGSGCRISPVPVGTVPSGGAAAAAHPVSPLSRRSQLELPCCRSQSQAIIRRVDHVHIPVLAQWSTSLSSRAVSPGVPAGL
jgi:hypothetical protein